MEYVIDYAELKSLQTMYERAPRIVTEELEAAVTEADLLVYRELSETVPVGAGGAAGLKGSLFHEERVSGAQALGIVASPLPHAVAVELGTKPHFPPVEALVDWVKAKFAMSSDQAARGVAFAIARKIAVRGTQAQRPFGRTFQAVESQVHDIFNRMTGRIARRLAGDGGAA